MYFPRVRLELTSTPPVYNFIKQPASLNIETQGPVMSISSPAPKLYIDETLPREEAGFRTMLSFAKYTAEQGRADVSEAIQEIAQEGDRLAEIQLPKSGLVETAEQKLFRKPDESNLQLIPMTPPAIHAEVSPISIKVIPGTISLQFDPAIFQYQFQYGKIKGQVVPESSSLDMTV